MICQICPSNFKLKLGPLLLCISLSRGISQHEPSLLETNHTYPIRGLPQTYLGGFEESFLHFECGNHWDQITAVKPFSSLVSRSSTPFQISYLGFKRPLQNLVFKNTLFEKCYIGVVPMPRVDVGLFSLSTVCASAVFQFILESIARVA